MEKIKLTTDPLFKKIVDVCWLNAGGKEEIENLEIGSTSYHQFIPQAIKKVIQRPEIQKEYPSAVLPSPTTVRDMGKKMVKFSLADSVREEGKNIWKFTLFNPNKFEWDCTEKVRYQWLSGVRARPAERGIGKPEKQVLSAPAEAISRKPRKARGQLQKLEERIQAFQQKERERVKASLGECTQIISILQGRIEEKTRRIAELQESVAKDNECRAIWQQILNLEEEKEKLLCGEGLGKIEGDEDSERE